jgi:hypothetical protein
VLAGSLFALVEMSAVDHAIPIDALIFTSSALVFRDRFMGRADRLRVWPLDRSVDRSNGMTALRLSAIGAAERTNERSRRSRRGSWNRPYKLSSAFCGSGMTWGEPSE